MPKRYHELGFAPIVIILILGLIGGSVFVAIRNNVPVQVAPSLTSTVSPAPTSSSTPSAKPSISPSAKPSPTPSPSPTSATPTPTLATPTPSSSPSQSPTSTPTSTPTSSPVPTTSSELMTVDKTTVNVTIKKNGKTSGLLYGAYPSGVTIKSNNGSGYSIINAQEGSVVGLGYGSSVGLLPGQSDYLAPSIYADNQNGTYTGTKKITFYDMQSKSSPGPTISVTIILTD